MEINYEKLWQDISNLIRAKYQFGTFKKLPPESIKKCYEYQVFKNKYKELSKLIESVDKIDDDKTK